LGIEEIETRADFYEPPYLGTPNPDEMFGTSDGEVFYGEEGADDIFGGGGGDCMKGDGGFDIMLGGFFKDTMVGGSIGHAPSNRDCCNRSDCAALNHESFSRDQGFGLRCERLCSG
jgi:hypothetical protein